MYCVDRAGLVPVLGVPPRQGRRKQRDPHSSVGAPSQKEAQKTARPMAVRTAAFDAPAAAAAQKEARKQLALALIRLVKNEAMVVCLG